MVKSKLAKKSFKFGALVPFVALPLAIAASCGDTVQALTPTQLENNVRLASSRDYLERTYHEQVLSTLNTGFDASTFETIFNSNVRDGNSTAAISDLLKYFLLQTVYTDRAYLKSYGQALLDQPQSLLLKTGETDNDPVANADGTYSKITYADVYRYRLLEEVPASGLPWIAEPAQSSRLNELLRLLLKSDLKSFRNTFYKFVIVYGYLDTNREDYDKVFRKIKSKDVAYRPNTTIDASTDNDTYVLTKQVLTLKPFLTWKLTLTEAESTPFVTLNNLSLSAADALLNTTSTASPRLPLTYSQRSKVLPGHLQPLAQSIDNTKNGDQFVLNQLAAFTNIERRAAVGNNSLSFYESEMQKITDLTKYNEAYNGYVFENNLVRENIQLFATGAKVVDMTRVVGLMPLYQNNRFNVNHLNRALLKQALYFINATDLYSDAMTYYLYKENPIRLVIASEFLRNLAIDGFGMKYVKKP